MSGSRRDCRAEERIPGAPGESPSFEGVVSGGICCPPKLKPGTGGVSRWFALEAFSWQAMGSGSRCRGGTVPGPASSRSFS